MKIIATYLTKTGIVAFQVSSYEKRDGSLGYSYTGKHGAGCGDLQQIINSIKTCMATRKGIRFDSGVDITL